jgi:hypothetical protein
VKDDGWWWLSSSTTAVLIFILVFVTHVHTNIPCMQISKIKITRARVR